MCLLIIAWQRDEEYALTLAANRDERYDRPTQPFTVLREEYPRTLGGKDLVAGGTWLAGLTNTPSPEGPDPSKRSRGEVPMLLTAYDSAEKGVEAFVDQAQPGGYNSARLLVGDRDHLFYLELSVGDAPTVQELPPGVHVLENAPLEGRSSKAHFVEGLLAGSLDSAEDLWRALPAVVASHDAAEPTPDEIAHAQGLSKWPATRSPCVHTEGYGTRSAMLLRVAKDPSVPTGILVSEGAPCTTAFHDVTATWTT
jgi:uncharacterized protein with NRDE domain